MNQLSLLDFNTVEPKTVWFDNIKATFTQLQDNNFDVVLEINSNKFLISMQNIADQIEAFQIIAIKGFIELSNKIILTIKRLVEHLRYRVDYSV